MNELTSITTLSNKPIKYISNEHQLIRSRTIGDIFMYSYAHDKSRSLRHSPQNLVTVASNENIIFVTWLNVFIKPVNIM